jgi:hypothetical protein
LQFGMTLGTDFSGDNSTNPIGGQRAGKLWDAPGIAKQQNSSHILHVKHNS